MVISIDYQPSDDSFDSVQVEVYQDDQFMCEISDLLDKAEGYPLAAMIESIDWKDAYRNSEYYDGEMEDYEVGDLMDKVGMDR